MKYIFYIIAYWLTVLGGGAWFFYNYKLGFLGILLALYLLYRQERQPRLLTLSLEPQGAEQITPAQQADFTKAVTDFNRLEAERRSLVDPSLQQTVRRMQHVARNFLYYLAAYPERLPLANRFVNYYQEEAGKLVKEYKKLAATGLDTEKVNQTRKRLRRLLAQLELAYADQFTQVLAAELDQVKRETDWLQADLLANGTFGGAAEPKQRRKKTWRTSWKKWQKKWADRFDLLTDGYLSSIAPALHHKINQERLITASLAFLLGSFGLPYFYLGKTKRGILALLFCWTFIPTFLGLVLGMRYLLMSSDEFYYTAYLPKYAVKIPDK